MGNWRTSAKKGQLQEQKGVKGRISRELQFNEEEVRAGVSTVSEGREQLCPPADNWYL